MTYNFLESLVPGKFQPEQVNHCVCHTCPLLVDRLCGVPRDDDGGGDEEFLFVQVSEGALNASPGWTWIPNPEVTAVIEL